jgi:type I restriction enzyme S subunit
MPCEWREYVFSELIQRNLLEIGDGYRAKNSELGGDGPIFLRAGHVRDTHIDLDGVERFHRTLADAVATKMSRPEDVIVTTKGNSTGRTSYVTLELPPFVYSPHLSYWRSRDTRTIVPGFLRYWSRSQEFREQLSGLAGSTDMAPYLSLVDQKRLRMRLPPTDEQRAIAHILGTLDDKIELNRRMNETLEAMARALFKSWFVNFDPIRAKADRRDPGLPRSIADLFPDSFEDSALGEIPKGWSVCSIGDHMLNFDSKRVPLSGAQRATRRGPYPYHGAAAVMDYVNDYLFDGIYLLVGEDGSVVQDDGMAVTQYVWGKLWVNNHAHVLQGKGAVSTELLYLHFSFESVAPYVTGAVQQKLSQGRMNGMPFVFAGTHVCRAFGELMNPLFGKLRSNSEGTKTLASLRDTLLPKLISGELRVKDAERIAEMT